MDLRKITDKVMHGADFKNYPNPDWQGIVIHHTGIGNRPLGSADAGYIRNLHKNIAGWLTKKDTNYVSAHFQISWFGEIWELIDPRNKIAYHAGSSQWWHNDLRKPMPSCNNFMLGVELLGDGNMHNFSDAQYEALIKLCNVLTKLYPKITPITIVGHEHVSPGRKNDPGKFFDWKRLFRGLRF